MLFLVKIIIFTLMANGASADDGAKSAYESSKLYDAYENEHKSSLLSDIEDTAEVMSEFAQQIPDDALKDAQDTLDLAESFNTDDRRTAMLKNGSIVGGISNETFAKAEQARRDSMKLEKEDQLYVFVSRSMPDELIRAYSLDANHSGAVVVMRGISEDETLDSFIRGELVQNIKPDGAGALVQIDPRLFDAFSVDVVPSIVYTNQSLANLCMDAQSTQHGCTGFNDDDFYKISGSVTVKYALEQFIGNGADEGAKRFLSTLKNSYQTGNPDNPKEIVGIDFDTFKEQLGLTTVQDIDKEGFVFEEGTDILKTHTLQTPFGPIEAPVGVKGMLKNIGGMEVVND